MALNEIPVLPGDYPLFDWSAHQASRNALVSGGHTAEFSKETWNAIAQALDNALTAGGIAWDPKHTTADGAKITQEYGDLRAAAFNSIRYNIGQPVPIGWKWATDPSFRGYVGREDFRGHDEYGGLCDDVYPEYILELVRRLNLLIGVMRGSAVYSMEYRAQMLTAYSGLLNKMRSAAMESVRKSVTAYSTDGFLRPSVRLAWVGDSSTDQEADAVSLPSIVAGGSYASETEVKADIKTPGSIGVESILESASEYFSPMFAGRSANGIGLLHSETDFISAAHNPAASAMLSEQNSATADLGELRSVRLRLTAGTGVSNSLFSAEALPIKPKMVQGTARGRSYYASSLLKRELFPMRLSDQAKSAWSAAVDYQRSKAIIGAAAAKTSFFAALSFDGAAPEQSWYDPVQTGSNLYIRSVWLFWNDGSSGFIDTDAWYEVIREGNNLYIRSVDSIWTDGNSGNIDTDVFLAPVREGNNLYIRQDIFGGE